MKNCPNCGTQNADDAKFCESCGTALSVKIPQPPPTNTGVSDAAKIGLSILSFLIPLAGIILGIINMNDSDPSKKAAGKLYLFLGIGGMILACLLFAAGGGGSLDY